ncbi:Pyruvate, phosphate dikinase, chloroplastic [Morella rubra]|uniref:Pyruvate, phosphate dikinase, chloroplastic n=1 Tax=Morella rubra TaxID=262757 RepID=A0A6A1VMM5_9ROSI|nr:Pyruvate, phosphate dikinase, chloroplastic [Morella rubra]
MEENFVFESSMRDRNETSNGFLLVGQKVFTFGKGRSEGNKGMKSLLGGKGANLAEMASIGLSVPPGLTISTEACQEYQQNGKKLPEGLWEEILEGLVTVEKDMGASLGDPSKPLLLSVRSGAAISMPGMMDTVLNLGLNDEVVAGLASRSGERFAYDSYRRFLDMFGGVVLGIPHSLFEEKLEKLKNAKGVELDTDLTASDLKELVKQYKDVYLETKGDNFPSDPKQQLQLAVKAVFDSWDSPRAIKYRSINQITGLKGTAVNIQCMVFGNMGNTSGTGVLFTRNPSTGEKKLYGEFLINAQGEDVVAGIRTPEDLDTMKTCQTLKDDGKSEAARHSCQLMDIEFTVQENRLWMLQCRSGKRTGKGAVKIAVDMVNEGLVDMASAIKMVEPQHLDQLLHPQFEDPTTYKDKVVAKGLPASPGAAVGQIVFGAEDAEAWYAQGKSAILVRTETSPEDVGDPKQQLQLAVKAVFDSWDSPRAIKYRSINQITGLKGTAVNIQCMVFGNMGNTSGTGVLFTRNPSTGEKKLYGEFLINAQGEDVVAGIRTPEDLDTMKNCMPDAYKELVENCEILERHYKDMMDIEFTVQENRLWMLQCRSGKRTGKGAVKIAVDMVNEGLVDMASAIKMVEPQHLDQLLHPQVVVIGDKVIEEGEWLSLNGSTGEVILGKQRLSPPALSGDLETFMSWADKIRRIKVMANADTPDDALTARKNGAQGIGLCRTEHMFFASDERIKTVRKMIMAVTPEQRKAALNSLLPYQRSDFEGIFRAMDGLPVTIRLLDPPLHEFLPEGDLQQIVSELTTDTGINEDEVYSRIEKLSEVNPMLGFRGCRLGISYPELTEMQARAIFQAAVSMSNQGVKVFPEIMVPLFKVSSIQIPFQGKEKVDIFTWQELGHQVSLIRSVAKKVFAEMGSSLNYKVGTMIEIPRAALVADEIAKEAEFFSFGTNDLTQMTFGYSRDDVGKFLPIYLAQGILQNDPFEVLDQRGVGQLIKMATERGRAARPSLKVGICGEHGGEPSSIAFFAEAGLDYVSCSPFRLTCHGTLKFSNAAS